MRRSIFERIQLEKTSGVICLEMMKKIQDAGFRIVEVPVHHYHRAFGKSQFFNFRAHLQDRDRRACVSGSRSSSAVSIGGRPRSPARLKRPTPSRRALHVRDCALSGVLPRPQGAHHRRPRIHRQQSRAPAGRARRRRAAGRFADPRLRRQPVQHRRHRRSRARQHRRHPAAVDDEFPRARSGGGLQSRRAGQSHRQHARSVHGSGDQLPQSVDDPRGVPVPQSRREGRVRRHPPDLRPTRTRCLSAKNSSCGPPTSTGSTRRPASTTIWSTTTSSACAPARCA